MNFRVQQVVPLRTSVVSAALLLMLTPVTAWVNTKSLPEPMTLEYALGLTDEAHADIEQAQAAVDLAEAEKQQVQSDVGTQISLEGKLRWVDPNDQFSNQSRNDSQATAAVRKPLWDFGRTRARRQAADFVIQSKKGLLIDVRSQRRIEIMAAYFAVMLTDLKYARDDELMAVAYVRSDQIKKSHELGQVAAVEHAKAQSEYQATRRVRYESDVQRRISRARLAELLHRPGQLSDILTLPNLPQNKTVLLEDPDPLIAEAVKANPRLHALRAAVEASRLQVIAARREGLPVVEGEIEAGTYARDFSARDDARVGISFRVPLYTGGKVKAQIAKAQAHYRNLRANLDKQEGVVRQAALEVQQNIYVLKAKQDEMKTLEEYRSWYIDYNRALYELDVKSDLGDAMAKQTDAKLQKIKTEFELALSWAQLDALLGKPVFPSADLIQTKPLAPTLPATKTRVPNKTSGD